jgi:hypothetical protein
MTTKRCIKCGKDKPLALYNRNTRRQNSDGRCTECKACRAGRWKASTRPVSVIPTEAEGSHRVRAVQEKALASTVRVSQCDGPLLQSEDGLRSLDCARDDTNIRRSDAKPS